MTTRDLTEGVVYTRTPSGVVRTYDYTADLARNPTKISSGAPANLYNKTPAGQAQTNSASMLADRIRSVDIGTTSGMMALENTDVKARLGLDTAMFEDYYFLDTRNSLGDMIYVVKVRDEADKVKVRDAFNNRLFNLNDAALATMPDKLGLSREGRIVENGRYMMLVVGDNQDAYIDRFYALDGGTANRTVK